MKSTLSKRSASRLGNVLARAARAAGLIQDVISIPNGSIVSIASGYAAAINITAMTNASPAVATATNTYAVGDFIEINCSWSGLNNKVVRVSAASGTTFTLEGIDTTNTSRFPSGGGVGTARKVTGYTTLSQIIDSNSSGGEQQFFTGQTLDADTQFEIPTVKTPSRLTFGVADDVTLPGHILAKAANDDGLKRAVKITLKSGGVISHNALISIGDTPSLTVNEVMQIQATMALLAPATRYAS
jgi:hypothetical protein